MKVSLWKVKVSGKMSFVGSQRTDSKSKGPRPRFHSGKPLVFFFLSLRSDSSHFHCCSRETDGGGKTFSVLGLEKKHSSNLGLLFFKADFLGIRSHSKSPP